MPFIRLFVGGLSDKIARQDLGAKLSHYGSIASIDLKERTDPEGNVLFRFAYVNLDAAPSQLEQCIQQLNGTTWKGSHLRVERAKESFLDRLNRERAARKEEEEKTYSGPVNTERPNVTEDKGGVGSSKEHRVFSEHHKIKDSKHSKKRKECDANEEDLFSRKNSSLHSSDQLSQTDVLSSERERKKKKNEVEEKILSSFKNFSSIWADSDNENDEGEISPSTGHSKSYKEQQNVRGAAKPDKLASHKPSKTQNTQDEVIRRPDKSEDTDATADEDTDSSVRSYTDIREEQQTQLKILESLGDTHKSTSKSVLGGGKGTVGEQVTRYDTILPEHQLDRVEVAAENKTMDETLPSEPAAKKCVKVAKDLSFGHNTSGFSLLAHFSRVNQEEIENKEVVAAPVSVPRSLVTVHQKVKKRPFFIASDNPEIKAAIEWMTQPITDEITKEFEEVLPDLRQLIKVRSFRARKEEGNPRAQRRGRGRGRGRGQGRGRAAGGDIGNPYQDHRWRERAVKK